MAPSPEKTIEPKAPDKRDSASNSVSLSEPVSRNTTEQKDNSIHLSGQEPQENPPVLSGLDEGQLKALLEEAITYKCPKDRECKSTLFKELLQEAESIEAPPPLSRTRFQSERNECRATAHHLNKHNQRQLSHGGSLQDLAESKFFENSNIKLDNYSSRKNTGAKRKTVSVSARQSEGGSLPSNVNNSSLISSYDRLFLYDEKYKFKKSGIINSNILIDKSDIYKNYESDLKDTWRSDIRRDYSDIYTTSCEINLNETASSSTSSLLRFSPVPGSLIDPDVIEECQALLNDTPSPDEDRRQLTLCDTISVEQEKNFNDEGIDPKNTKLPRLNFTSHAELHVNMENNNQSNTHMNVRSKTLTTDLGSTIQFSQLDSKPLLISPAYSSMQCIVGTGKPSATLSRPIGWLTSPVGIPGFHHDEPKKSLDENGNSLQAFNSTMASSQQQNALKAKREKPKQKKADRNVKVIRSEEVVGHRNETNIDLLVKFIENDLPPKKVSGISKLGKGNYKSDNVNKRYVEDKNSKKKDGNRKSNKDLQRNLFKSNSLEEVSCSMLEDLTNHNSDITMRNKLKKETHASMNDRRSWGEVSYMDDSKYNGENHKKKDTVAETLDPTSSTMSESALVNYSEFAEFHVVTKKKKPKKFHDHNLFNDDRKMQRNDYYHSHVSKYQENDYSSNHDLYTNHCKIPEQRRKSTSSMPPSDKSDSSDLDSVHSLPVESTSKKLSLRQVSTSSGGTPQASYADIAKMANVINNEHCNDICFNPDMQNKWTAKPMFPSLIESTTINEKGSHPKTMSLNNYNFPDLIESCHYYSEVQKKKENEENDKEKQDIYKIEKTHPKLKLTQSKSVDIEDNKNSKSDGNNISKAGVAKKMHNDGQKFIKTKCDAIEQIQETRLTNSINNTKENRKTEYLKRTNKSDHSANTEKTTSDLVSDCIHYDNLNINEDTINTDEGDNVHYVPPVIILDEDFDFEGASSNDIIFGFEVNEKLLSGELSDTDSSNTIVYQETEISDANSTHDEINNEQKTPNTNNLDRGIVKTSEAINNVPNISSQPKDHNCASISARYDKNICDNQDRINNAKCVNKIQFIPPTNVGGFENHDKLVSFIGIAWDEILKGGTAQYYTG